MDGGNRANVHSSISAICGMFAMGVMSAPLGIRHSIVAAYGPLF